METQPARITVIGLAYLIGLPALGFLITLIPMTGNAVVELPFLENSHYSRVLVFAGFPECATACPVGLTTLQQTYQAYQQLNQDKELGVIFVNIRRDMPAELSRSYIKRFHKDFEAYSSRSHDAKNLYTTLAIKTFSNNERVDSHQGYIYLLGTDNNQWHLKKIFNNNVSKQTLLDYLTQQTT